jgi:XTP/dITP diphosphohydrolase
MLGIVLATRNRGKIKEMKNLLKETGISIKSILDLKNLPEIEEKGKNYRENARIKAEKTAFQTGKIAIADDSGLEVYALNRRPGKNSARFIDKKLGDKERNKIILDLLKGVPLKDRQARFCCVVAIAKPDGEIYFCEGYCVGLISEFSRGNKGFGYDPIFFLPKYNKTFAEMDISLKNKISHRGIALRKAKEVLIKFSEEDRK